MRVSSADSFSVSMPANGLAGAVFRIAVIKSVIATVAASMEEAFSMGTFVGNQSMVSSMHSARVSTMNAR